MSDIILDAYAARSCPVKTFNLFDPTVPRPQAPEGEAPDESLGEAFHGGKLFEAERLNELVASAEGVTDLRALRDLSWAEREAACMQAMARGDRIIVDGVLPIDRAGHRKGRPDLLMRGEDTADGRPGYHPVEVKLQLVVERRPQARGLLASRLAAPTPADAHELAGWTFRSSKATTLLQMAHYWRILDAAGHAASGSPLAGVIGQDRLPMDGACQVSWVELDRKLIRTFSRTSSSGWKLRSPLERYDHEHRFRVHVAELAVVRTGVADPPPPVVPVVVRECDNCVWWERCRTQLDDEAITLRINKSPLDVREIATLSSLGVDTIIDLANVDLDGLLPDYLPHVRHREGSESRLRLAAHRAQLLVAGVVMERTTRGPIGIPGCDLEIDFDIETADNGRTYLWGMLLTDRTAGTESYVQVSDFTKLGDHEEVALLDDFAERIVPLLRGRESMVYHYSDYEKVFIARLARGSSSPAVAELVSYMDDRFVDLFAVVREHFFGVKGLGLKVVANAGPGFAWRDDDPGGLNSQTWHHDALFGRTAAEREAARLRVLEYNEDDVRATNALREWLRTLG